MALITFGINFKVAVKEDPFFLDSGALTFVLRLLVFPFSCFGGVGFAVGPGLFCALASRGASCILPLWFRIISDTLHTPDLFSSGAVSISRILARNQRLDEITKFDSLTRDGMRIVSAPVARLHNAHALLHLLEEEYIVDGEIPRLYYDALQIVIANGGSGESKGFYGEGICCESFP
jgi:hypothetical protein